MAKNRIKIFSISTIFLIISCIPKPFAVSREGETVKVYFEEIRGSYSQLVDKTQFYVLRNSNGWIVPVEDSLKAEYYTQFSINSSLSSLKNPEVKIYEVFVRVKHKKNPSFFGMTEAKDKGRWDEVVTPISKELADNLVSMFNEILKEKNKKETPEPEKEIKNE